MFIRILKRKNKDGFDREYLYLVENKRSGKKTIQKNLVSLGRLDELKKGNNLTNILKGIAELTKGYEALNLAELSAKESKEYGLITLYRKVWEKLEFSKIFQAHFKDKKAQFDIAEAILAMVINRLTESDSKRETIRWIEEVYEPEWEKLELQHLYRALDYLVEKKEDIELAIFKQTIKEYNQELDVIMFDTTSLMHWGEGKHSELLKHGHSKDKRFDLKQIIVGVLMTKAGIPVAHEVWEGNQIDLKNFQKIIAKLKNQFKIGKVIMVCDKGMISAENICYLEQNELEYILGVRLKKLSKELQQKLLSKQGFKPVIRTKDKYLDVKDVVETIEIEKVGKKEEIKKRYIICFNEIEAKKDEQKRERFRYILENKIPYSTVKHFIKQNGFKKYIKIVGDNIHLAVDYKKLDEEAVFDGMWAITTNNLELDTKEAVKYYKGLAQIESGFRDLKSEIEIDPFYHWTSKRIRAHVFICFLALILKLGFEKKLKDFNSDLQPTEILRSVQKIKMIQLLINNKKTWIKTNPEPQASFAFNAIGSQIHFKNL